MLITVHPDHVAPAALASVDVVVALGESPDQTLSAFADTIEIRALAASPRALEQGQALVWRRRSKEKPFRLRVRPPRTERHRHKRKYAEGVDDDTWRYHLRQGDYSRWFRDAIKDEQLAAAAAQVESRADAPADETRARIREAIRERYTLPA